jgi:hypothetical protein
MKRLILLSLIFFAAPTWATLPPVLRLDKRIAPLDLPARVQVLYTDALGYVALRVRVQGSSRSKPETLCMVMRPSAYPPTGVASNEWVSADEGIVPNFANTTLDSYWNGVCNNP